MNVFISISDQRASVRMKSGDLDILNEALCRIAERAKKNHEACELAARRLVALS